MNAELEVRGRIENRLEGHRSHLNRLYIESNVSWRELARQAGTPVSTLHAFAKGAITEPKTMTKLKISRLLHGGSV